MTDNLRPKNIYLNGIPPLKLMSFFSSLFLFIFKKKTHELKSFLSF